jgi:hypothetical protein
MRSRLPIGFVTKESDMNNLDFLIVSPSKCTELHRAYQGHLLVVVCSETLEHIGYAAGLLLTEPRCSRKSKQTYLTLQYNEGEDARANTRSSTWIRATSARLSLRLKPHSDVRSSVPRRGKRQLSSR